MSCLDCSIDLHSNNIQNQFYNRQDGTKMSWENYGRGGWSLDHVQPLCTFKLSDRQEFLEDCNWLNIQPLWEEDNWKRTRKLS